VESGSLQPGSGFLLVADVDDEGALVQVAELQAQVAPKLLELPEKGLHRISHFCSTVHTTSTGRVRATTKQFNNCL